MATRIQKISSKGQVTLPAAWRKAIATDHIVVETSGTTLQIRPMHIPPPTSDETVLFDAWRDNDGNPITPQDVINLIEQINAEETPAV